MVLTKKKNNLVYCTFYKPYHTFYTHTRFINYTNNMYKTYNNMDAYNYWNKFDKQIYLSSLVLVFESFCRAEIGISNVIVNIKAKIYDWTMSLTAAWV